MTTPRRPVLHGRVLPFHAMTPTQQADHLIAAHGFGADYFWRATPPSLAALDSDTDVLHAWQQTDPRFTDDDAGGYCYPLPSQRGPWHDDDHAEYAPHGGGDYCPHTHDKPTPEPQP